MVDPIILPGASVSQAYNAKIGTVGIEGADYHAQTMLPPGISLDATGQLSGVPTAPGVYDVFVRISTTRAFRITVSGQPE